MSLFRADKITGRTGSSDGAPITLSGDTATLGSGATIGDSVAFPTTVFAYVHFSSSPTTIGSGIVPFTDRTQSTHSSTYGWDLTNHYYRVEKTGVYIISVIIEVNGTGAAEFGIYKGTSASGGTISGATIIGRCQTFGPTASDNQSTMSVRQLSVNNVLYARNTGGSRAFNTADESSTSMNICLIRT